MRYTANTLLVSDVAGLSSNQQLRDASRQAFQRLRTFGAQYCGYEIHEETTRQTTLEKFEKSGPALEVFLGPSFSAIIYGNPEQLLQVICLMFTTSKCREVGRRKFQNYLDFRRLFYIFVLSLRS